MLTVVVMPSVGDIHQPAPLAYMPGINVFRVPHQDNQENCSCLQSCCQHIFRAYFDHAYIVLQLVLFVYILC